TYPSYALNLAQLGALCISNLCATKPLWANRSSHNTKKSNNKLKLKKRSLSAFYMLSQIP
ncbi:hypothetical protein, partial [Acinetobacter baumannii]|uniref:hypothetical protein n=1 Tax=Acinetobacter baumannii TaxID=470 RepID=UPI0034DB170E